MTFKPTYLYVKIHNKTGLKYFGKTTSPDPFQYRGSGTWWQRHLEKYGDDVSTKIIGLFKTEEECRDAALKFSVDNNIMESKEWANLKLETLEGGFEHINRLDRKIRKRMVQKWWLSLDEQERHQINIKKIRMGKNNGMFGSHRTMEKNPMWGKTHSDETKRIMSEKKKNKLVVKDKDTGVVIGQVDKNHEKVKSGEWVCLSSGLKRSDEVKKKMSIRRKGRTPACNPKGTFWWTDGKISKRSVESPGPMFYKGRHPR